MTNWFLVNENLCINVDSFSMFRVREDSNEDMWTVEACDLRGAIKIVTCDSQLEAQSILIKIMGKD